MEPFHIETVSWLPASNENATRVWKVKRKLVTKSPLYNEGSIETAWEVLPDSDGNMRRSGTSSRQRIAVYSGPENEKKSLHVSFELPASAKLPEENGDCSAVLAWSSFREEATAGKSAPSPHLVLCCLISPTAVTIWDVYPDGTADKMLIPAEGWTVTLPFECCGIFAMEHGLLLQRCSDADDLLEQMLQDTPLSTAGGIPPAPLLSPTQQPWEDPVLHQRLRYQQAGHAVASLFTLQHPLQDVLPVTETAADASGGPSEETPVTDPHEQVLWVGTTRWLSNDGKMASAQLMVTYHTERQRHAVWSLQEARQQEEETQNLSDSLTHQRISDNASTPVPFMIDSHVEDLELLDPGRTAGGSAIPTAQLPPRMSRDEALADALGVVRPRSNRMPSSAQRRPVRKSMEPAPSRPPRTSLEPGMPPLPSPNMSTSTGAAIPLPLTGPLESLRACTTIQCLYEETAPTVCADEVFLASNMETTGTLVLAFLSPNPNGNKDLKLFSLKPQGDPTDQDMGTTSSEMKKVESAVTVEPLEEAISCLSAQPVQACPIPPCCLPPNQRSKRQQRTAPGETMATDILVLQGGGLLSLYRASTAITACSVPGWNVSNLEDPVNDQVTLWLGDETMRVRGKVRLVLDSVAAELVLSAVDASLFLKREVEPPSPFLLSTALRIRADSCRTAQSLSGSPLETSFGAVVSVLSAIASCELLGKLPSIQNESNKASDAWQSLLDSDYHQAFSRDHRDLPFSSDILDQEKNPALFGMNKLVEIGSLTVDHVSKESSAPHEVFFPSLFDSLHFLYEESKLSLSSSAGTEMVELQQHLAGLLVKICQTVQAAYPEQGAKAELFLEYYRQDLGDEVLQGEGIGADMQMPRPGNSFSFFTTPPSIFSWMDSAIKGMSNANSGKIFYDSAEDAVSVNAACSTTRSVCRILAALLLSSSEETSKRDVNVVLTLMAEGFTEPSSILEDLPPGVSLPILEVLCRCRNNPALEEFPGWSASAWMLVGREDLSRNMSEALAGDLFAQAKLRKIPTDPGRGSSAVSEASNGVIKDEDGMVSLEESSAMLFPEDNRVHEAARLLRSSRPIFLRVARAVEVSDHDYERLKQKRLLQLSYRALALQIGRGMLTIGGLRPISAEPLPIPDLCLQGRVPPTNATLNLDVSACPADLRVWPEFHNGVAAGLRLPCDGEHMGFKITRTWILYNRPPDSRQNQSEESGEDANIALQSKSHSHGGLLLALGLRGHLTALEFSDLYQYLTQGTITTTVGVLLGMAANRRASCDISVSKMLCLHIPSLIPQHFNAIDVASTVQTAAVTGCGLLFQGSSHRMMTEFLLNEIGKRPDSDLSSFDRESYTLACGLALGMVNLCLGDNTGEMDRTAGIADLRVEERLHRYIVGGIDPEESRRMKESNDRFSLPSLSSGNDTEKCSTIFEGEMINTDITAPASILALGLMYMKTENQTVASALALPDTHFLLEFVRPDFLGLRVISRALILWNKVEPTDEWIENQVPEVIRAAYQEMRTIAEKTFGGRSPAKKPRDGFEYDRRAVRQVYLHIVSGACFGIGLRYAGTGDERAKKALYQRVMQLHALRESNDPVAAASKPEKTILDTCLGCTAISLAMVMVGTGDLDTLRLFKILRWRCDKTSQFGMHMVYGMAIGLLFLGGGTCTLGRAPQDLAALVAAFFPRFPMTGTSDDQYHLQATRHLYALAVHRRDLRALDIDTGESVHVDVKIEAEDDMQEPQHFTVPCLLRNSDFVAKRLRVASEKYFPVTVDLSQRSTSYIFYVKKRTAVLGRTTDPFLPSQPFGKPIALQQTIADLVRSLTDNPFLVAFAENLCAQNKNILSNPSFDSRAVLASLTEDHEDALPIYLALRHAFGCFRSGSDLAAGFVWNLRLLRSYYQECKRIVGSDTRPLLDTQLMLPYLHESTDQSLASRALAEKDTERFALILYG